jgi:hypothetical protein
MLAARPAAPAKLEGRPVRRDKRLDRPEAFKPAPAVRLLPEAKPGKGRPEVDRPAARLRPAVKRAAVVDPGAGRAEVDRPAAQL